MDSVLETECLQKGDTKSDMNVNDYGLVLAGGGGKGAYEIGVMKYLQELDISITAVSGTSVGALNAALYAGCDFETSLKTWLCINSKTILMLRTKKEARKYIMGQMRKLSRPVIVQLTKNLLEVSKMLNIAGIGVGVGWGGLLIGGGPIGVISMGVLVNVLLNYYCGKWNGFFSREGLLQIINGVDIASNIKRSSCRCYSTCYDFKKREPVSFCLNDVDEKIIPDILLASSAIPVAYDSVEIEGRFYCDGGAFNGDNVPIKPLYDIGYKNLIVVYLEHNPSEKAEEYKDTNILQVIPSKDLGNLFTGTLNFEQETIRELIGLGYFDAKEQLGEKIMLMSDKL